MKFFDWCQGYFITTQRILKKLCFSRCYSRKADVVAHAGSGQGPVVSIEGYTEGFGAV